MSALAQAFLNMRPNTKALEKRLAAAVAVKKRPAAYDRGGDFPQCRMCRTVTTSERILSPQATEAYRRLAEGLEGDS